MKHGLPLLYLYILRHYSHPYPYPSGHQTPEEDQQTVFPIYSNDLLFLPDFLHNLCGYLVHIELQGVITSIVEQRCPDETWADVGNGKVLETSNVLQLGKAFQIMVYIALCGRIGGGSAQPLRAGNAADNGNLCISLWLLGIIIEHRRYHAGAAECIGFYGSELLVKVEFGILVAYARTVEIEVDVSTHFADKGQ